MYGIYQRSGTTAYRAFGRLVAKILGRHRIVEAVYLHRSVATGEVDFGRSDIDLGIVIPRSTEPEREAGEIFRLYETVRRLRRINPAIGEIEVHDADGLCSWIQSDSYRGSIERRSLIWAYGEPVDPPSPVVSPEDCIRRAVCWFEHFVPVAMERRNGRNMRKYALSFWDGVAIASGLRAEPLLRRAEIVAECAAAGKCREVLDRKASPEAGLRCLLRLAKQLHDQVFAPLGRLEKTVVLHGLAYAPWFVRESLILLPNADSPFPAESYRRKTTVLTPEALHLFLHFFQPYLWWSIPAQVRALGVSEPDASAFLRAAQIRIHSHLLRFPGFMHPYAHAPRLCLFTVERLLEDLENAGVPRPIAEAEGREWIGPRRPLEEYYRDEYPQLLQIQQRLWWKVERLLRARPESSPRRTPA